MFLVTCKVINNDLSPLQVSCKDVIWTPGASCRSRAALCLPAQSWRRGGGEEEGGGLSVGESRGGEEGGGLSERVSREERRCRPGGLQLDANRWVWTCSGYVTVSEVFKGAVQHLVKPSDPIGHLSHFILIISCNCFMKQQVWCSDVFLTQGGSRRPQTGESPQQVALTLLRSHGSGPALKRVFTGRKTVASGICQIRVRYRKVSVLTHWSTVSTKCTWFKYWTWMKLEEWLL